MQGPQVVPFGEDLAADWDRTVYSSPDGWPFSLTAWRRAILEVPRWQLRDHSLAVFDDGYLAAPIEKGRPEAAIANHSSIHLR